jgi:hypothetical protein
MKDPFTVRRFTRERGARWQVGRRRYPKKRYQTKVESWRAICSSANIEFTMKRLREPKQP